MRCNGPLSIGGLLFFDKYRINSIKQLTTVAYCYILFVSEE